MATASLAEQLAQLDKEDRERVLVGYSQEDIAKLMYDWNTWAREDQRLPEGDWFAWALISGRGAGKALALETPIPTPDGWKLMGEIAPGDEVFDESGRVCRVTATFDVMPERAYRLRFSDGTHLDACSEHQWVTWTHAERKAYLRSPYERSHQFPEEWPAWRLRRKPGLGKEARVYEDSPGPRIRNTQEIVDSLAYGKRGDLNHCIPTCLPLQLPEVELPVEPYLFGLWLGDGSSKAAEITVSDGDREELLGVGAQGGRRKEGADCATYSVGIKPQARDPWTGRMQGNDSTHSRLRALGVLRNKHIPAMYLRASAPQRLALLRGLMDSDGYCDPRKAVVEFCNTNRRLVEGFVELARSLGQKPVVGEGRSELYGVDKGPKWRVTFRPTVQVFSLHRKAVRLRMGVSQSLRHHHRMIVGAEVIEAAPMRCLTVDSRHSMFLVGEGMIPTHNTRTGAETVKTWVGGPDDPPIRVALIAESAADARDIMVSGESGILSISPPWNRPEYSPSKRRLTWPNGSIAIHFSGDKPDQLRGPQFHKAWVDEIAKFQYPQEVWDNLEMGLRLGNEPQAVVTTTPRPIPIIRELMTDPSTVVSRVSTYENLGNLPTSFIRRVLAKYEGTRLGRQELHAELLMDTPGALWNADLIEANRVSPLGLPSFKRSVVGVDVATGSAEHSNETGIVGCSKGEDSRAYVRFDRSGTHTPNEWAKEAIRLYFEMGASRIVAEKNQGGEMIRTVIHSVNANVPVKLVHASKSKQARAEPVAALMEQSRCLHVGMFAELEDQMIVTTPEGYLGSGSPDRMDAMVWAVTELMFGAVASDNPDDYEDYRR